MQVKIPKLLHEIHGEVTTLSSLVFIYTIAIVAAISIYFYSNSFGFIFWKQLLLLLLTLDIAGGVVANSTKSTREYYDKQPKLRVTFIILHVLQPLALWAIFQNNFVSISAVYAYTLFSCLFINSIKNYDNRKRIAFLLTIIGILFLILLSSSIGILEILLVLYMVKLIFGFSVGTSNRY